MAIDRREAILARLIEIMTEIMESIDVKTVARNQLQMSPHLRPAIVILDGNEEGVVGEFALGRPLATPRVVSMMPEIYIMLGGTRETLGGALNAMRVAIIKAILEDTVLPDLVTTTGGAQYQGCVTDLSRGGTTEGQMMLTIAFHYPVRASEL